MSDMYDTPRSVCVDLDGVIAVPGPMPKPAYNDPDFVWDAYYYKMRVAPGAAKFLGRLKAKFRVVIHTSRRSADHRSVTELWLLRHSIPHHELVMDKPLARAYIDDRAIFFAAPISEELDSSCDALWESLWQRVEEMDEYDGG